MSPSKMRSKKDDRQPRSNLEKTKLHYLKKLGEVFENEKNVEVLYHFLDSDDYDSSNWNIRKDLGYSRYMAKKVLNELKENKLIQQTRKIGGIPLYRLEESAVYILTGLRKANK